VNRVEKTGGEGMDKLIERGGDRELQERIAKSGV